MAAVKPPAPRRDAWVWIFSMVAWGFVGLFCSYALKADPGLSFAKLAVGAITLLSLGMVIASLAWFLHDTRRAR